MEEDDTDDNVGEQDESNHHHDVDDIASQNNNNNNNNNNNSPQQKSNSQNNNSQSKKRKRSLGDSSGSSPSSSSSKTEGRPSTYKKKTSKSAQESLNKKIEEELRRIKFPTTNYSPIHIQNFSLQYPTCSKSKFLPISKIDSESHSFRNIHSLSHPGILYDVVFSPNHSVLASCSKAGTIRLWNAREGFKLICEVKDSAETNLEEFYTCTFSPNNLLLFAAGKLKNPKKWDANDNDYSIIPSPIKIFDLSSLSSSSSSSNTTARESSPMLVQRIPGHEEEILCIKLVSFKRQNYMVSCSQDGYILQYLMSSDYKQALSTHKIDKVSSNIVFWIEFLPNCGNKFFLAAADNGIKLLDFETRCVLKIWEEVFTGYCDYLTLIPNLQPSVTGSYTLLCRGCHEPSSNPNFEHQKISSVKILSLYVPFMNTTQNSPPKITGSVPIKQVEHDREVKTIKEIEIHQINEIQNENLRLNVFQSKIGTNGKYISAGSVRGLVQVIDVRSGKVVAMFGQEPGEEEEEDEDEERRTVRSSVWHEEEKWIVTCSDRGVVNVYEYTRLKTKEKEEREEE